MGIPGSLLAMFISDSVLGRKGAMSLTAFLAGVFLVLFSLSTSGLQQAINGAAILFLQSGMYGVLYAYTPEVYSSSLRGTGTGKGKKEKVDDVHFVN